MCVTMEPSAGATVLVVDDEDDLRFALGMGLKKEGYRLLFAGGVGQAREVLARESVDVVISDLRMPDGSGVELLDELRARDFRRPVVILMTGFMDITAEEAFQRGADASFSKPFDPEAMRTAIRSLLLPAELRWSRRPEPSEAAVELAFDLSELSEADAKGLLRLGRGGMFAAARLQSVGVGTPVKFRIRFGEGPLRLIEGWGVVRWNWPDQGNGRAAGCGIEFCYLTDACRAEVARLAGAVSSGEFIPDGSSREDKQWVSGRKAI